MFQKQIACCCLSSVYFWSISVRTAVPMNIRHFHTSFDPNITFFASRTKRNKRDFDLQQTSKNSLLMGFNFSHQEALRLGNGFVCRYRSQAEDRLASLEASKQILFPLTQSAKFRIFLIRRDVLIRRTQYCLMSYKPIRTPSMGLLLLLLLRWDAQRRTRQQVPGRQQKKLRSWDDSGKTKYEISTVK